MYRKLLIIGFISGIVVIGCQSGTEQSASSDREDPNAIYKKQRRVGDLEVGDEAPDFTLKAADSSGTVQLSSFEVSREVVLIFGSYT
jgi:hypothetical protein